MIFTYDTLKERPPGLYIGLSAPGHKTLIVDVDHPGTQAVIKAQRRINDQKQLHPERPPNPRDLAIVAEWLGSNGA